MAQLKQPQTFLWRMQQNRHHMQIWFIHTEYSVILQRTTVQSAIREKIHAKYSKRFPKSLSKLLRGFSPSRYSRRVRLPAKMLHLHCNIRMYTVIYSTPQTQFLGESAGRLTSWASLFHPYTIEYDKRKNRTAETQLNVERLPLQLATLLRLACLRTMAPLLHSNCHL